MTCCVCFPVMGGGPVTFDYAAWILQYPQFAAVTEPNAEMFFTQAGLYLDNSGCSPVKNTDQLTALLYLLTAHLAWLFSPRNAAGNPDSGGTVFPPTLVGRISQATEGSVSLSTDFPNQPASAAWYQQTPWGAAYWAATAQFRMFRYIPPPIRRGAFPFYGAVIPRFRQQ